MSMENSKGPSMRTIKRAAIALKELDPETCITERILRKLVSQGKIPYMAVGTGPRPRKMINFTWLIEQLEKGEVFADGVVEAETDYGDIYGRIRKIQ